MQFPRKKNINFIVRLNKYKKIKYLRCAVAQKFKTNKNESKIISSGGMITQISLK
jgi:hypothetical protein